MGHTPLVDLRLAGAPQRRLLPRLPVTHTGFKAGSNPALQGLDLLVQKVEFLPVRAQAGNHRNPPLLLVPLVPAALKPHHGPGNGPNPPPRKEGHTGDAEALAVAHKKLQLLQGGPADGLRAVVGGQEVAEVPYSLHKPNNLRAQLLHLLVEHMHRRLGIDDEPAHQHGNGDQNQLQTGLCQPLPQNVAQRGEAHIHAGEEQHQTHIGKAHAHGDLQQAALRQPQE